MTYTGTIASFATLLLATAYTTKAEFCWKDSYGRGVGTLPKDCGSGNDYDAGLCYPQCKSSYKGVGPVCLKSCPDSWTDHGFGCTKPEPYGRGGGYPWNFGDSLNDRGMFKRCQEDHGNGNCERWGLIVYPKCKSGFHNVACCICSPDCPDGYPDTGATCLKPTYGRGVGLIPTSCTEGKEYDAGLCYPSCDSNYNSVGPVCWGTCAPGSTDCGAGCVEGTDDCFDTIKEQVVSVLEVVGSIAETIATAGGSVPAKIAAKITIKSAIQKLGKNLTKDQLKKKIKEVVKESGKAIAENSLDAINDLAEGEDFDWTNLDPTGISAVVQAYNKPTCK